MGLRADLKVMREHRHLKRGQWPWTKILLSLVGVSILSLIFQFPAVLIMIVALFFQWLGEKLHDFGRLLEKFADWVRDICEVINPLITWTHKENNRLDDRKRQFSNHSWKWINFWRTKSIRVVSRKEVYDENEDDDLIEEESIDDRPLYDQGDGRWERANPIFNDKP